MLPKPPRELYYSPLLPGMVDENCERRQRPRPSRRLWVQSRWHYQRLPHGHPRGDLLLLSYYDGMSTLGKWTLRITDTVKNSKTGSFTSWTLSVVPAL